MILRAAIVTLLVLNLGVAAWWISGANAVPVPVATAIRPGTPTLRLVDEPAAASAAAPAAAIAPPSTQPTPPPPVAAESAVVAPAKVEAGLCLRFGPFADAAARDAARPALASASAVLVPRDTPARSSRGWKVHLPPFATRDEARAMGEKIKAAGITDWYLLNEGADANGIALGRYGGEEAARRREAELRAKGIPAQAVALGDSVPQWWLDARLKPEADLASLVGAGPSKRIDCATLR
jgi:hypothetical protein